MSSDDPLMHLFGLYFTLAVLLLDPFVLAPLTPYMPHQPFSIPALTEAYDL